MLKFDDKAVLHSVWCVLSKSLLALLKCCLTSWSLPVRSRFNSCRACVVSRASIWRVQHVTSGLEPEPEAREREPRDQASHTLSSTPTQTHNRYSTTTERLHNSTLRSSNHRRLATALAHAYNVIEMCASAAPPIRLPIPNPNHKPYP